MRKLAFLGLMAVGSAPAWASINLSFDNGDIRSTKDGWGAGYSTQLETGDGVTYFLNDLQIQGGSQWDDDLNGQFFYDGSGYNSTTQSWGFLPLGEPITDTFFSFTSMFGVFSLANVGVGFYTGTARLLGGADANATDVLGELEFTLEVVEDYFVTVATPDPNRTLNRGEGATFQLSITNSSSRPFVSRSRYFGVNLSTPGDLYGNFDFEFQYPDGWGSSFGTGTTTLDHVRFTARQNAAFGLHGATMGLSGGYYPGDRHVFESNNALINVVPEPATLAALGVGVAALLRRKRR